MNKNLLHIDYKKIPYDEEWNFEMEKESKMHKIHAYPAKFPAFITNKAIEYAVSSGIKINTISDIFCGCGTTALEAKKAGIKFWGCDISPVAALIARVKSRKYQTKRIINYRDSILKQFNRLIITNSEGREVNERIKYWYSKNQIIDLLKLKKAIFSIIPKGNYRDFFLCAFSNILKASSHWLTKSIKPQSDKNKIPANPLKAFNNQINFMINANKESIYAIKSPVFAF